MTSAPPADLRFAEVPPERPRLGSSEHPNLERPGATPHPAARAPIRVHRPRAAGERPA